MTIERNGKEQTVEVPLKEQKSTSSESSEKENESPAPFN